MKRYRLITTATLMAGAFALLGTLVHGRQSGLSGLTDALSHPPPTTGTFAFSSYGGPSAGQTYVDPVFGSTVRRLTTDHKFDDLYGRNMWWNADATKYYHYGSIIDTATGAVTHTVQKGSFSSDAGFDPVDPNAVYYISGATIHKIHLGPNGTTTDAVWFTAPATLNALGGSENWLSADGRLLVVSYGSEPAVHVYDTTNFAAGPFAGAVPSGSATAYSTLVPSGRYLITPTKTGGISSGSSAFLSYAVDRVARTVNTSPNTFWNLCGDHAAYMSPSDGRDYAVIFDCHNDYSMFRVDVSQNLNGQSEAAQQAANKVLWSKMDSTFSAHFSAPTRGPLADWVFVDTEVGTNDPSAWKAFQNEIVGVNVLTGERRRLAHHRSVITSYVFQPRISVSWGGELIGWATNFGGTTGTGPDVVAIVTGAIATAGDTTPPTISLAAPTAGATLAGSVTLSANASDDVAVAGVQFLVDGAALGAEDLASPYQATWTTTGSADGTHTVSARARDLAGNVTTSPSVSVTVANIAPPPIDVIWPTVSLTAPLTGATVSGAVTIAASASDDVGVVGVQFMVDGAALGAEDAAAPYQAVWNTTFATNGPHNITATARDAAGHTTTTALTLVTVNNVAGSTLPGGAIFGDPQIFGDARTLSIGAGIEMPAGSAALLREFGVSDGVTTLTWRVNGTTVSVVLNGAVIWTGTSSSATLLRVEFTGNQIRAIRNTTVRGTSTSSGPAHVLASGTVFPALIVR